MNTNNNIGGEPSEDKAANKIIGEVALYFIGAVIFSIWIVVGNRSGFGFFQLTLATILGVIGGTVGGVIGSLVRKFALPDMYFTTGGIVSIMALKLFWLIGPQLVGWAVGMVLSVQFVLHH